MPGWSHPWQPKPIGYDSRGGEGLRVAADPQRRLGDLRHLEYMVLNGRLIRGDDLRTAAGLSGLPD